MIFILYNYVTPCFSLDRASNSYEHDSSQNLALECIMDIRIAKSQISSSRMLYLCYILKETALCVDLVPVRPFSRKLYNKRVNECDLAVCSVAERWKIANASEVSQ